MTHFEAICHELSWCWMMLIINFYYFDFSSLPFLLPWEIFEMKIKIHNKIFVKEAIFKDLYCNGSPKLKIIKKQKQWNVKTQ